MQAPWLAFALTPLTPTLVRRLEAAALAVGRLDARVCASFAQATWQGRSLATGLTRAVLPCLAIADPAWRYPVQDPAVTARRMLRALADAANVGLHRLHRIERDQVQATKILGGQLRAGTLRTVLALAEQSGAVTPRGVGQACNLSLSGAGKLLARAALLGLLVEVSGRTSWRTYLVPDLARQFGYLDPTRGRPPAPALPPLPLDATLAAFDAEMAAIDALLSQTASDHA